MKRKYLALAIASGFSFAGGALAQQAPADGQTGAGEATTITVTARRREESLQDVPAAVTAFSGAQLEKIGVPDVTALAEMLPNTTLKTSRATNTTLTAFIRGVGQQDPVAGYEQGVGIYLDDIYLARPQGAVMDIYDVERIEVLRGPQGTLYGRNTIGGAVKYVTKRLSAKPELEVKATLGNYSQANVSVKGSTPVGSGNLRVGGTIASFNRDGFGKNVVNGKDNYNKDVTAGRFSVEWMPSDALFVRFATDRTVDDSLPRAGYRLTPGPAGEQPLSGDYDTAANLYTVLGKDQRVVTHGSSLLFDWTISPTLSFKSITAKRGGESRAPIDFDSLQGTYFEAPAIYHDDQFSQEFQLTYLGDRVQGVAGVFYMDANAYNRFDVLLPFPATGGLSLLTLDDIDTKTWAAFVDLSYALSDTVNLSVGGRYTDDKRNARIFKATYLGAAGSPTLGNPAAIQFGPADTDMSKDDLERNDSKFTPKLGVDWKFSPTQTLYATYSEGYKGGMFDPRMSLGGNPTSAASLIKREGVEPEEVSSIELGLKSRFANGRVQTNVAAFSMDYRNVQIPGSVPIDANNDGIAENFAGTLTNAGKATIRGLEFEFLARLADNFTLSGMYSYIDAKYDEWIILNPTTNALDNVAAGAEFQNTPRNSAHLSATWDWPLALFGRAGSLSLTPSLAYKSKTYQFENARTVGVASWDAVVPQAARLAQDGYSLYDLSLVWTSADRKLEAGLHGRNLTDKRYKVAGYTFAGFSNTITTFYGDPRTVAATVRVRF